MNFLCQLFFYVKAKNNQEVRESDGKAITAGTKNCAGFDR